MKSEERKWLADVVQEYSAVAVDSRAGSRTTVRKNALIAQLTLRAPSALEAMEKATDWLSQSKIGNAYVSQVCSNSIDEVNLCPLTLTNKKESL